MSKKEFLEILRSQLDGAMSQNSIEENIRYYDQYISEQVASGKSEEDVMNALGSPIMIAKTLTDVAGNPMDEGYGNEQYYQEEIYEDDQEEAKSRFKSFQISAGVARWLIPLILFAIIMVVFLVLGAVTAVVARFFLPIMLVLLLIYVFRTFTGGR